MSCACSVGTGYDEAMESKERGTLWKGMTSVNGRM